MKKSASARKIRMEATIHTFGVRDGFPVSRAVASRVGPVILKLMNAGCYSPKALVEEARDPRCPAHRDFDWNNKLAAEKWRIEQAKLYQRAIVYDVLIQQPGKSAPERVQMRLVQPLGYSENVTYHTGGQVLASSNLAGLVLEQAFAALESWRNRYNTLRKTLELSGVFGAIEQALATRRPSARPAKGKRRKP